MLKYLILLMSIVGISSAALADQKTLEINRADIKSMSVVAPVWEGFTNADGTGLYWELLRAIYEPVGIKVRPANVAWNRAIKMVTKYSVYNAIVGESKDSEENLLFPSFAIDVEYTSVLSLAKRRLPWNGVSSLTGKKVGWMKDYDLVEEDKRDFELIEYRSVEQGLELLESGRIDYMLEEWDEIAEAVAAKGQDMSHYLMNEMPDGTDVFVAFSDTQLSRSLIEIYNERLPVLYQEKTLQAIYKKWEMDIPESITDALN